MKRYFILILSFYIFSFQANAQKVGLVLSGGGAKGLAHIAVIRALEENGIPIDYIAGTSMGAIIAGLYAAGYSPDEMDKLFKSEQFKFWSTGEIQKTIDRSQEGPHSIRSSRREYVQRKPSRKFKVRFLIIV